MEGGDGVGFDLIQHDRQTDNRQQTSPPTNSVDLSLKLDVGERKGVRVPIRAGEWSVGASQKFLLFFKFAHNISISS
jgi:hypothetical protein